MEIVQIIILAFGLSMDSLVIALTSGAIIGDYKIINLLKVAGMLAFMQSCLTIAGWFIGSTFAQYIDQYDHWLAFGILFFLGVRVLICSIKGEENSSPFNPLNFKVMFSLGVATSIDATAVGLSMSLINQNIILPAIIIGTVTFILSSLGVVFGSKVGQRYNNPINIIGGIILIVIGFSILAQHTILKA